MEEVCKELDKTKAAMAKLMEEFRAKSSLVESLRSAHNDQLTKIRQMKQQIESHTEELKAKSIEIDESKRLYQELRISFHDKEVSLRQLNSVNEQIRTRYTEKLKKYEEEKSQLISALDGTSTKCEDQEQQILAFRKDIENLKGALSIKQKKCSDADEMVQTVLTRMKQMEIDIETKSARLLELSKNKLECEKLKSKLAEFEERLAKENSERIATKHALSELRKSGIVLNEFEIENSSIKDKLKWKKEQFSHLEEAHRKLQDEFRAREREWQAEKNASLDAMEKLQENVSSQSRMLEDFKSRLQMCHQALTHEENRRKLLEIQVKESQSGFENIAAEFEEAKTKIESLTLSQNKEIADLRVTLAGKETLIKEMGYKQIHLEQGNKELQQLVNELQESQITEAGMFSSVEKLKHKVKALEQAHKERPKILAAKEAECISKVDNLIRDLDACHSDLKWKETQIRDLQMELENCQIASTTLLSQSEENCLILLVMCSEISQAQSNLDSSKLEIERFIHKKEAEVLVLNEHLEKRQRDLETAMTETEDTKANMGDLLMRIESLDALEQQSVVLRNELQQQKEMLAESMKYQDHLREESSKKEIALRQDLNKAADEIEKAYADLADKTQRQKEMDFELQRWKYAAERLKETQVETDAREETYHRLMEQLRNETEIMIRETERTFEQKREKYEHIIASKSSELEQFKEKMLSMEQKFEQGLNVTFRQKKLENEALSTTLMKMNVVMDELFVCHVLAQVDVNMKNDWILELEKDFGKLEQVHASQERLNAVKQEQIEMLCAKSESVESLENKFNQILTEKDQKIRHLKQKLESGKQFSLELKEKLWQLESENLHSAIILAIEKEQMEKVKPALSARESMVSNSNRTTSIEREEIENLKGKLQEEEQLSLDPRQQIQPLEGELNKKLQTEEYVSAVDRDSIANLEQPDETLTQKLFLQRRLSAELKDRIKMLEEELEGRMHAEQELLALQYKGTEQVNSRLASTESANHSLTDEMSKLRIEIKGLEEKLMCKEWKAFEMKERMDLLERDYRIKLHDEEEQRGLQQQQIDLLNARLISLESTNNDLNYIIQKLRCEVDLGRDTSEKQNVQIQNCEEQLRTSKNTITGLLHERDRIKRMAEFFAALPDQMDCISRKDLNLLKSLQSIAGNLSENLSEKLNEPFHGDGLSTDDGSELAVVDLIRQNQKLLEDLDKHPTPRKEIVRTRDEKSEKIIATSGMHLTDTCLERLPLKQLNGY